MAAPRQSEGRLSITCMDSAFAKLGRAKAHYAALNDSIEGWRARLVHEWSVTSEDHLIDDSQAILKVHLSLSEEPPSDWGLIIGDILTNLRAALDHSIFVHAVARQTLTEAQERSLTFPVLLERDRWLGSPTAPSGKHSPAKRSTKGAREALVSFLDPAVLDVVEQSQPYTMNPAKEHALAELSRLVNLDKHRAVRVVTFVHEAFELKRADLEVLSIDAPSAPYSDGGVVATLRVRRKWVDDRNQFHSTQAGFHFSSTSYEALELPSDGLPEEVRHVMQTLIEQVEEVLNCFKAVGC